MEAVGTGGAQKCRGAGAPNPNRNPNQPLCHAVCAAAIVFDVVAKARAMANNFLKFYSMGSTNGVAFGDGVSGFGYALGVGKMYTWSVEGVISSGL